jgi:hypothetical protein
MRCALRRAEGKGWRKRREHKARRDRDHRKLAKDRAHKNFELLENPEYAGEHSGRHRYGLSPAPMPRPAGNL